MTDTGRDGKDKTADILRKEYTMDEIARLRADLAQAQQRGDTYRARARVLYRASHDSLEVAQRWEDTARREHVRADATERERDAAVAQLAALRKICIKIVSETPDTMIEDRYPIQFIPDVRRPLVIALRELAALLPGAGASQEKGG